MLYTEDTLPRDDKTFDNYHTPTQIEKALRESNFITHSEHAFSRDERYSFDSNIRRYYLKRPVDTEDSLQTIKAYNYLNPDTVVMQNLSPLFGLDEEVTAEETRILLGKGVFSSTIERIKEQKADVIAYYNDGFEFAVESLSIEERTDERVAQLKEQYTGFKKFPYILMGKDIEHCPHLRVTMVNSDDIYYALCTTMPQNVDDLMGKKYIEQLVHYMLGQLEENHGYTEIGLDTDLYYDFYYTENAILYLFLHLMKF